MRVGVYIDGFNLYYGLHTHFQSPKGWKWLDLRALAGCYAPWQGCVVDRVVFCTAPIKGHDNEAARQRQAIYWKALKQHGAVDEIEQGFFNSWSKEAVMSADPSGTKDPTLVADPQALMSWDSGLPVRRNGNGLLLATVRKREEKGSDVNVASHLLHDVLSDVVDAAIVVTNDSDLGLPVRLARQHVPVGVLSPHRTAPLAGTLKGKPDDGVGGHVWGRLDAAKVMACQLPDPVGDLARPASW